MNDTKDKLKTSAEITWCPGCPNFIILEAVKKALAKLLNEGFAKQEDLAIVTGIGCHAKIFDYLNLGGFYGLHGRVLPTALGIKIGNPNLTVIGFEGDGDAYAEGMEHFIHAGRYNSNMTLIVHDNQAFALTTGQSTPTSQQGYISKATPLGEKSTPLNPIKLALASGVTFIARTSALNLEHCSKTIEKAIRHKGFSYVEIIQPCLQFNKEMNEIKKSCYEIPDNKEDKDKAMKIAGEWDYNTQTGKIPIGVIYQSNQPTLEEKWPQLSELLNKKVGWKGKN